MAGFAADWVLDLDLESFESLVETVDLEEARLSHAQFVDAASAVNWSDGSKDHERDLRKAATRGMSVVSEFPKSL